MRNISDLLFASGSRDKASEFRHALSLPNLKFSKVSTPDVVDVNLETLTRRKIEYIKDILPDVPFFVDHTGLHFDALNGLPGGQTGHFVETLGCKRICQMLDGFNTRAARARTVIGLHHEGNTHIFEGTVFGTIAVRPQGDESIGFDSVFIPRDFTKTYAELGNAVVYEISMRKLACDQFVKYLEQVFTFDDGQPYRKTVAKPNVIGAENIEKGSPIDVFISHASEDKNEVARPLAAILAGRGLSVWLDEAELTLGDSLRQKIDDGLSRCRYGVVVMSPAFFSKQWPQRELDGLVAKETASGQKAILPIWHGVDQAYIVGVSPPLADRLGASSSSGLQHVAEQIIRAVGRGGAA
jgi:non-canonical purine NTP pyrophosphatase (RdgB/HAM1 family)